MYNVAIKTLSIIFSYSVMKLVFTNYFDNLYSPVSTKTGSSEEE